MDWHRAQPQCQLNWVAACIDLAFRKVWMNTRNLELNYINHLISVIFFCLLKGKKCVLLPFTDHLILHEDFLYISKVFYIHQRSFIYQNIKLHQKIDLWECHHVDDVYSIIDRKNFLLYSPFYVTNSVRMLNKTWRIFVWQHARSPLSRLCKKMQLGWLKLLCHGVFSIISLLLEMKEQHHSNISFSHYCHIKTIC